MKAEHGLNRIAGVAKDFTAMDVRASVGIVPIRHIRGGYVLPNAVGHPTACGGLSGCMPRGQCLGATFFDRFLKFVIHTEVCARTPRDRTQTPF